MQHLRRVLYFWRIALGAWAGVVNHQTPALGRAVVDIGGGDKSYTWAIGGEDLDGFDHAVNGTGE